MLNKYNKKIIKIEGMSCIHCSKKVEDVLKSIQNIKKVKVDLKNKEAVISFKENIDNELIKEKIETLGYKVISIN